MSAKARKVVETVITAAVCAVIIGAGFGLFFYLDRNNLKIYFGGKIYDKSFLSFIAICLGLLLQGLSNVFMLKEITDKSERTKRIVIICVTGLFLLAGAGFVVYDVVADNPDVYIEKIDVDGEKGIVLVEKTDKISTDYEYTNIFVYQKNGLTVKQIDRIYEDNFVNKKMISDKQYTWEYVDGTFKVALDYGGLADGVTWTNDEFNENPPDFIRKEYVL